MALRPLCENLVGGFLLRLQDKFREGDNISFGALGNANEVEGEVDSITYLHTRLRKDDNSITVVPNKVFMDSELVNWSRTPFRLFTTSVELPRRHRDKLETVLREIETRLSACDKVEVVEREVLVAATGFKLENIVITVQVNLKTASGTDRSLFEAKNTVVQLIADCLPTSDVASSATNEGALED